jgi:DNA polymerase I-like protein with 3'-5' exonuclease and polymerase domains
MTDYALVIDLEVDLGGNRKDPSPYNKDNTLVAIGYTYRALDGSPIWDSGGVVKIKKFPVDNHYLYEFQEAINEATYIVAHNAKFDLAWLREVGIECDIKIIDTMISEYVLSKGIRNKLSLDALSTKYNVIRKQSLLSDALSKGLNYSDMSEEDQRKYLYYDVMSTAEVFEKQQKRFQLEKNKSLVAIRDLMCQFCSVLTDIERSGMAIDLTVLDQVDQEYEKEQADLNSYLSQKVRSLMGDLDVNLSSPEQLSQVIYSCKLLDKNTWKDQMNIGLDDRGKPLLRPNMDIKSFRDVLSKCFKRAHKVRSIKCVSCYGKGGYFKIKKDGTNFKKETKCPECLGKGTTYQDLPDRGGLNLSPRVSLASAGGFKTDKGTLTTLLNEVTDPEAKKFLESIVRLSAIETYRSAFIEGIRKGIKSDGLLHANFNQCITATGRLSSSSPNLQNMPKGRLFPVRKAFVSRFDGGSLVEIDYSQLEFRIAGILATDETVKREVESGFDVHAYTAKVLTDNGEPTERGAAKASTFRPLYGGTQGTPAQRTYFKEFFGKYRGIFKWHEQLQNEAIKFKVVKTATGRQFSFPDCERNLSGSATFKTQIVNYPVQSVATAEIVPLGVIILFNKLREMKLNSIVINTVHDSVLIDTHPDELDIVKSVAPGCLVDAQSEAKRRFGLSDYIPLEVEMSQGKDWMHQEGVDV